MLTLLCSNRRIGLVSRIHYPCSVVWQLTDFECKIKSSVLLSKIDSTRSILSTDLSLIFFNQELLSSRMLFHQELCSLNTSITSTGAFWMVYKYCIFEGSDTCVSTFLKSLHNIDQEVEKLIRLIYHISIFPIGKMSRQKSLI